MEVKRYIALSSAVAVVSAAVAATGCAEFWVQRPRGDGTPVVRAADFGFSGTNDFNAAAVNRALEHCRRTGAHTLELAPGTYNCFDAPHGMAITNMTDFTFDGRGAVLVFRPSAGFHSQPQGELLRTGADILVGGCERTLVCDITLDCGWNRRVGVSMASNRHLRMQDVDVRCRSVIGMEVEGTQEYWQMENVRIMPGPHAPCERSSPGVPVAYKVASSRGHAKHVNVEIGLDGCEAVNFQGHASGAGNVIVRNCMFAGTSGCNLASTSNLTIEDCLFRGQRSPSIRFLQDSGSIAWNKGMGGTNAVIRNNVFVDPCGPVLDMEAGADVDFRGNEICFAHAPFSAESGAVRNAGADGVTVEGNSFVTNPPPEKLAPAAIRARILSRSAAPLYAGIYDKEDPPPADRAKTLAAMAAIRPPLVSIERRNGRNVLLMDGRPTPLNQYKGFTDYRLMGECGGNFVITFNRGTRLFQDATFDRADLDLATGTFDFSRIEDTLLRIYAANPKARVLLTLDLDPDKKFLDLHPDSIFTNEKGVRGRSTFGAFSGFDSSPLDPGNKRVNWAYSYTSAEWQAYVKDALVKLCAYLKSTPAANIVAGFHLAGGMDGQFVQWQYGPENGHFDYSESNRRALCAWLRETYGTDAALQAAWGDPSVTLATARNPSVAEFRARTVFDDRPGFGRRLADCRRFVAIGPARALNGIARTLRSEFGRPCLVETWYSSTIWSQPGRLAVDELLKDGGVNVICTVSGYRRLRALDGPGGAADNSIAGLNLRGILYVQEMDHRTWRAQHVGSRDCVDAAAIPADEREFATQVRRDAASVIAAGGAGFHLFDMFGSWYHGSKVKPALREIFALNSFATAHAGEYPLPRVAIFTDEKARLMCEKTPEAVNVAWRTSGLTPAIHYLSDLDDASLPDYGLCVVYSPVTLTLSQAKELRRRADEKGSMLVVVGTVAAASRDFTDASAALAVLAPEKGTFLRVERERELTPENLNAWARKAGIVPFSEPGNATYVGNGVACVHRLKGTAFVDFGRDVRPVDPYTGREGAPIRIWRPELAVGESKCMCYRP